ncbi:Type II secretion system protein E [Planctomycetes bacterium CA13]|uniref:Type II secretion system protein E n=1 Tax=Novipirellula herctigrandis TaxID=2527986 RepID=A0A5C5YP37_9BACT|nr:Type II secretion system protein E [Planctomycetes bacterium CA13]
MNGAGNFSDLIIGDPNYAVDVVDRLIPLAWDLGASDVHLQPRRDGWEVLLRVDGVLSQIDWVAGGSHSDPVTRLMVIAGLPTYRDTQPMEGRLKWSSSNTGKDDVAMRLGVFPTVHGPRAVIRLLRKDNAFDRIESLGMSPDITQTLVDLTRQTDGAILLSGPAGSGKTTTLYAMLRRIAASVPRRSVLTIEDPVESVIGTISQSELDPSSGMTLASALRSAVRQDSEALLVSEIRDPETAEAAMQASLTGHLVFSSLHASDVAASMRRLVQFGVPPFAVRSGVRAIVSQRLLRRLCSKCGGDCGRDAEDAADQGQASCQECLGTGYRGRVVVADCVRFDGGDEIGEVLAESLESGASVLRMRSDAKQVGANDLRTQALRLVDEGITDNAEVYRVLGG